MTIKVPRRKIPNLNTFSTLIDRLCIENVKKSHFEYLLDNGGQEPDLIRAFHDKILVQNEIIAAIRLELTDLMIEILKYGTYDYVDEERTFS